MWAVANNRLPSSTQIIKMARRVLLLLIAAMTVVSSAAPALGADEEHSPNDDVVEPSDREWKWCSQDQARGLKAFCLVCGATYYLVA